MKRIAIICLLLLTTIAHADPSCRTYSMDYNGNYYAIRFSCETSGIGAAYPVINDVEYPAHLYMFTGDMIYVLSLTEFEYVSGALWHDSGLVFLEE